MPESPLTALKQKIDDLISLCTELNRENLALKEDTAAWHEERDALIEKNQIAASKVESILTRLKAAEQSR